MIARCPNCLYGYEVESHGKYRCGVCGKKFFLFRNGAIESADDVSVETQKTSSDTDGRRFHTGSVILGHYRVIGLADVADSRVIYRCFDEKIAEHVFLQDLFPDVAIADEKTAVRFQVIAESEIQTESSAASAPAVAPVVPTSAPAAPVAAVAPVVPTSAPVSAVAPVVPKSAPAAPVSAVAPSLPMMEKITLFTALKKYAVFNGRATRKEFWLFILLNLLISLAITIVTSLIGLAATPLVGQIVKYIFNTLLSLGFLLPTIAVTVRRMHDLGKSGWLALLYLVPCVGFLVVWILACLPSQMGDNRYGSNPHNFSC